MADKSAPEKAERTENKRKGLGAQEGSNRREFRKFRPRPKKATAHQTSDGIKESSTVKVKKPPFCRFFNTVKGCRLGGECPFRHEKKEAKWTTVSDVKTDVPVESSDLASTSIPAEPIPKPVAVTPQVVKTRIAAPAKFLLSKDEIGSESQLKARETEIMYFKRRYRHCSIEKKNEKDWITFRYEVTEPDWVFDIRSVDICLKLSSGHPVEIPAVSIPDRSNMPEILRQHMEKEINDAIKAKYAIFISRNKFEVIGKLLIRWIDHNILDLFVGGLKKVKLVWEAEAAGISLVVPAATESKVENQVDSEKENEERSQKSHDSQVSDEENSESEIEEPSSDSGITPQLESMNMKEKDKPPIDVVLVWNDLSRNVASIAPVMLHIATTCARCKCEHSHDVPANDKPVLWRCSKCATAQSLRLRASLVHEHSCVLAQLDARGCRPVDCVLLNSRMKLVCLACNREDDVQKINFGQPHKSWCRECHAACEFVITVIRFRGDFSRISNEDKEAASKLPRLKKKVESAGVITPGGPLPALGTCKHYEKSYRWFRFPCCGRVFPCDTCHEEATGSDHEMKQANRMVCGHCSTEQPFQKSKPCSNCSEAVTRSKSHFWEGGKGCRDKLAMNKNDGHKFAGGRKKTVAKKSAAQLLTKNKK